MDKVSYKRLERFEKNAEIISRTTFGSTEILVQTFYRKNGNYYLSNDYYHFLDKVHTCYLEKLTKEEAKEYVSEYLDYDGLKIADYDEEKLSEVKRDLKIGYPYFYSNHSAA